MKKAFVFLVVFVMMLAVVPVSLAQGPDDDTRMVVWESFPESDGQLQVLTAAGLEEVLMTFPPGKNNTLAKRCGQDYWVGGGQSAALYIGGVEGDIALYPVAGGAPVNLAKVYRMTCSGTFSFQTAPNGQRVGFIDYAPDAVDREYAYGNLRFFDATAGTELATFDWTNTFTLYDDGALMLRIFPDGKGNGTEADVVWWDGAGRRTLTTLEPTYPPDVEDVDCGITGGAMTRIGDSAYVLVAQECEIAMPRNWQIVRVPMAGGAPTEVAAGVPVGGVFSESFTTELFPALDGSGVLMAIPSGLTRNTVSLIWVTVDGVVTPVLEGKHIISNRYGEFLTEGRHLQLAMNGAALAFVTVTGNGEQALWMLGLSTTGGQPILLEEEGPNQRIFQYLWGGNNTLYFAAGSIESSSLYAATQDGATQRLERGRFYRLAVSYAGDKVAAAEWFENPNSLGEDLFKITLWDTSGYVRTFKEGGEEQNELIPLVLQ
jgi:hypothetical protein